MNLVELRFSFSNSKLFFHLLSLQVIWLFTALVPGLSILNRLLVFVFFVIFGILLIEKKNSAKLMLQLVAIFTLTVLTLKVFFSLFLNIPNYLLQFLSLGIDNDPHIQMFKDMNALGGQIQLVSYPKGQQTIWLLMSEFAGLKFDTPISIIAAYGSLYLLTLIFVCVLAGLLIYRLSKDKSEVFFKLYFFYLVLFLGSFGFMIVGGYPHYMWALVVLLILANVYLKAESDGFILGSTFLASIILYFTCQPFALVTGLLLFALLVKLIRASSKATPGFRINLPVYSALFGLVAVGILGLNYISKVDVFNWVTDDASAEPLSAIQVLVSSGCALAILKSSHFRINSEIKTFLFSLIFVSAAIASFTSLESGFVTYYGVKQVQFSLILVLAILIAGLNFSKSKSLIKLTAVLIFVAQFIPTVSPKNFDGPLMGSTFKAVLLLTRPSQWEEISINANQVLHDANSNLLSEDECAVYWMPERNLISKATWFNSIQPRTKHRCLDFAFLAYVSDKNELKSVVELSESNFVLFYEKNNKPDLQFLASSKVRFVELTEYTPKNG